MSGLLIALVNCSTVADDADLAQFATAIETQANRDFLPAWGAIAGIDHVALAFAGRGDASVPAGYWPVFVLDHSDEAGDLGYHIDNGGPSARVFAADDIRYGASLSVTLSHEVLEMLADPLTTKTVAGVARQFAVEICDPVEADGDGYVIAGTLVSNFVLPSYFGIGVPAEGARYDFRGLLAAPCPALRPGGYQLVYRAGQWQQISARGSSGRLSHRAMTSGRNQWRSRTPGRS